MFYILPFLEVSFVILLYREDSVELYHSLMYTTVFVEVYQCVCRSIPYSILQLIPTKLGGNQLQNTVWCMYGILLQTHWYTSTNTVVYINKWYSSTESSLLLTRLDNKQTFLSHYLYIAMTMHSIVIFFLPN